MKTTDLFRRKSVLSMEVFSPTRTTPVEAIYQTLEQLQSLQPDFISVTYNSTDLRDVNPTLDIAALIKHQYGIESVAHLPCSRLTKEALLQQMHMLKTQGIENILALRGDLDEAMIPKTDFPYASDMIAFIREHGDFNIIAACYPEGHPESDGLINDIWNLRRKVDAGASQLITQLFFSNRYFYAFRNRAVMAGIHVPIEAGILPIVSVKQMEHLQKRCGVKVPRPLFRLLDKYGDNPDDMREAGIEYAITQINDLLAQGVDGIHLYTMNNPYVAERICAFIRDFAAA